MHILIHPSKEDRLYQIMQLQVILYLYDVNINLHKSLT